METRFVSGSCYEYPNSFFPSALFYDISVLIDASNFSIIKSNSHHCMAIDKQMAFLLISSVQVNIYII